MFKLLFLSNTLKTYKYHRTYNTQFYGSSTSTCWQPVYITQFYVQFVISLFTFIFILFSIITLLTSWSYSTMFILLELWAYLIRLYGKKTWWINVIISTCAVQFCMNLCFCNVTFHFKIFSCISHFLLWVTLMFPISNFINIC